MNTPLPHGDLLAEIDDVLPRAGISPTRFGEVAMGDRHLIRQLRAGRECRKATVAKIRAALDRARVVAAAKTEGVELAFDRQDTAA